jgi:hypothetical protein
MMDTAMSALTEHETPTTEHAREAEEAERKRRNLLHVRAKRLSRRDRSGMLSRTRR